MDSLVMMSLGDFRFGISTAAYTDLQRSNEYRWPSQERIGAAPARQFVGPGDDTIELSGTIYPHFRPQRAGLEQVSRMRAEAEKGEPLLMVDGAGRVWGEYVILSIRETQRVFFSDGRPRSIEFSLSLGAYGRDNFLAPIFVTPAKVVPMGLPDADSLSSDIAGLTEAGPGAISSLASKVALALPSARQLFGISQTGITELGGVLTTAQAAISAGVGGVSRALSAVDGLKRGARGVMGSFDMLMSSAGSGAFVNAGHDLSALLGQAKVDGVSGFSRVVEVMNGLDAASAAAEPFFNRITQDADARAVMRALQYQALEV